MKTLTTLLLLLGALLLASPARAAEDEILLKTGAVLKGRIVKETDEAVVIRIEGLGKIEVRRSRIVRIEGGAAAAPAPAPAPVSGAEPPREAPPVESPAEVPYEKVRPGQTLLVLLEGVHHGSWVDPGTRYLAEIPVLSPKRAKLVFDPAAGVEGYAWVPRERIRRIIDVTSDPERLVLFLDGVEGGAWLEGIRADGASFAGQLAGVAGSDRLRLRVPGERSVKDVEVELSSIRVLSAVARSPELRVRLDSLEPGEPVSFAIRGRDEVRGRLVGSDRTWFILETPGPGGELVEQPVFRGLPILEARLLPEPLRAAFRGLDRGGAVSVVQVREDERSVVRRTFTGKLLRATTESIALDTPDGAVELPVSMLRGATRPTEEEAAALLRKRTALGDAPPVPVLPGMPRDKAEKILGEAPEGLDLVCDGGEVVRVFCRPPFAGPLFGIRLGSAFSKAVAESDLVFDTQVDPKAGEGPRVSTMLSHSLPGYLVKLYVAETGEVLAAEISRR